jgi:hypothetical protein
MTFSLILMTLNASAGWSDCRFAPLAGGVKNGQSLEKLGLRPSVRSTRLLEAPRSRMIVSVNKTRQGE